MGSTHFKMKTLKHVATEMALHVLAYNMKRVMAILGVTGLVEAIAGQPTRRFLPLSPFAGAHRVLTQPHTEAELRNELEQVGFSVCPHVFFLESSGEVPNQRQREASPPQSLYRVYLTW